MDQAKPVISLCMIVGNEAAIIERCLNHASGAFDELCLVRAIGGSGPDLTVNLARAWCRTNGKIFNCAEYNNKRPLSHVDDFGAARNVSFGLASGDWILWLDADDLVDDPTAIRKAVARAEGDCIVCPYCLPSGAEIPRERLIRRGKGVWVNAVHETCRVSGLVEQCPQVKVFHAPGDKQASSAARNLAIVEAQVQDLPRHWYYYHEELYLLGRPEATAAGIAALKILPEAMDAERYEVLLNMASLDPAHEGQWIWQAIQIQPLRREAWAYVVQHYLAHGNATQADLFLRTMRAIPVPDPRPWTHRAMWYGWGADYLAVRVLRMAGKNAEAEAAHARYLQSEEYRIGVERYERTADSAAPL